MTSDQVGGIVRAIISALGGFAIGKGIADAATVTAVGGALATIAMAIWSYHTNKAGTTIA